MFRPGISRNGIEKDVCNFGMHCPFDMVSIMAGSKCDLKQAKGS